MGIINYMIFAITGLIYHNTTEIMKTQKENAIVSVVDRFIADPYITIELVKSGDTFVTGTVTLSDFSMKLKDLDEIIIDIIRQVKEQEDEIRRLSELTFTVKMYSKGYSVNVYIS